MTAKKKSAITAVKQGDKGWQHLEVVEGNDVRSMADVLECDVKAGTCARFKRGDDGKLVVRDGQLVVERVKGKFEIRKAAR